MAINISRYVDITSVVGGSSIVPTRMLIGRFFTGNLLLQPQSFVQFDTAAEVGSYFGFGSEEYFRSVFYFSWISKNGTQPQAIQFARWAQSSSPPMVISSPSNTTVLGNWTSITSGSFILNMGIETFVIGSLNFGADGSLSAVATTIQDAIQAASNINKTGTIISGMNTVTGLSSTSNLFVGMNITGTDIPSSTTIASIINSTSITMSANATGNATLEALVFSDQLWAGATVSYSSSTGFTLTGGLSGEYPISVMIGGGGSDITGSGLLGWIPEQTGTNVGGIWINGSIAETITQTLINSSAASNNFGTFAFLTNLNLTQQNVIDAATWNNSQNVLFMYLQGVTPANASAWQAAIANIGGVGLVLSPTISQTLSGTITSASNVVSGMTSNAGLFIGMPVTGANIPAGTTITSLILTTGLTLSQPASGSATELLTFYALQFPEQIPMMIEAATDYTKSNAVQNYEFQQFAGITPSVTTDALANVYDGISVNYYGQTQTAGTLIAFFQRGVLQGLATNPLDMNVYANEQWLKDASTAAIMNALLVLSQIPANAQGRAQILSILQEVINQALLNGTISIGKTLTQTQILFITQVTNDPLAYQSVQASGYWVDAVITASGSPPSYSVVYTLVYSKDDVIRFVEGTDILI